MKLAETFRNLDIGGDAKIVVRYNHTYVQKDNFVWRGELRSLPVMLEQARKAIARLQIDGGYGRLTSLWLEKDGTCVWHGYEPGMRWGSIRRSKLPEQEIKAIWESADRLVATPVKDAYASKHADYTLILVLDDKTTREIRMKYDKTTEKDDRPQELKTLVDKLWATRSRKETK
jgi:hypothetical protein